MKIFNKKRKKLVYQNQFKEYLIYAIGEIFLVVIGILIAIQANNWNENRKFKIKQNQFLISLKEELKMDTLLINSKVKQFEEINRDVQIGKNLINKNKLNNQENIDLDLSIGRLVILTPINKNVKRHDLKLSDGIISDYAFKMKLLSYYETIQFNNEVQTKFGEILQQISMNHISPIYRFGLDNDMKQLRQSVAFMNSFEKSIAYRTQAIKFLNTEKELAEELLDKLKYLIK